MRSADLSRMARASQNFMSHYASGLDSDAVRRRSRNKARIMNFFGVTDLEWVTDQLTPSSQDKPGMS
jgi:lysine 2,3-aminomutase